MFADGPMDEAPGGGPDNRASRRERLGLEYCDLPWYGVVPNVGAALGRLRAMMKNRHRSDLPRQTPVLVDVVPLIHARAARGSWSARWSTARVLTQHAHRTFTAPTTAGDEAAEVDPTEAEASADRPSGRGDPPDERPGPTSPITTITTTPTRGPNRRALGTVPT
jgi:hypothetical protein